MTSSQRFKELLNFKQNTYKENNAYYSKTSRMSKKKESTKTCQISLKNKIQ